jgi:5-methylcytosine-specific restriction endonuclease McrBC regulatory subunit McrC
VIDLPLKFRGKIKHANSIRENAPFSSLLHVNYRIFRFDREVMILVDRLIL